MSKVRKFLRQVRYAMARQWPCEESLDEDDITSRAINAPLPPLTCELRAPHEGFHQAYDRKSAGWYVWGMRDGTWHQGWIS